jgi:hypothetical protein
VRFPKKPLPIVQSGFRVTRAKPGGNADKTPFEAGKICRDGINCRAGGALRSTKSACFIGFFAMARGLLIFWL